MRCYTITVFDAGGEPQLARWCSRLDDVRAWTDANIRTEARDLVEVEERDVSVERDACIQLLNGGEVVYMDLGKPRRKWELTPRGALKLMEAEAANA